jgi:sortase A
MTERTEDTATDRSTAARRRRPGRWLAAVQYAALGVGLMLLAFWAVAWLHGRLGSQNDLSRFKAARARAATPPARTPAASGSPVTALPTALPDGVDTELWSRQRIEGYRESFSHDLGLPMGILRISSLNLEVPIHRGTDELTLNRGAGWIEGTALPGSDGNVGLAAHRDGFFRVLKDIEIGAPIVLETLEGVRNYRVVNLTIVEPNDVEVLAPRQAPALTLVTCYPFYFVGHAPQRFIVHAEEVAVGQAHRSDAAAQGHVQSGAPTSMVSQPDTRHSSRTGG